MDPQSVSASILLQRGAEQQGRHGAAAKVGWGRQEEEEERGREGAFGRPRTSGVGCAVRAGPWQSRPRAFRLAQLLPPLRSGSAARLGSSPARPRRRTSSPLPFVPSRDAGTPAAAPS